MLQVYLKVGGLGLLKLIQAKENFALEDGPTQPYIATRRFQKGTVLTMQETLMVTTPQSSFYLLLLIMDGYI